MDNRRNTMAATVAHEELAALISDLSQVSVADGELDILKHVAEFRNLCESLQNRMALRLYDRVSQVLCQTNSGRKRETLSEGPEMPDRPPTSAAGTILAATVKAPFDLEFGRVDSRRWRIYQGAGGGPRAAAQVAASLGCRSQVVTLLGSDCIGEAYVRIVTEDGQRLDWVPTNAPTKANIRFREDSQSVLWRGPRPRIASSEMSQFEQRVATLLESNRPGLLTTGGGTTAFADTSHYVTLIRLAHEFDVPAAIDFSGAWDFDDNRLAPLFATRPDIVKANRDEMGYLLVGSVAAWDSHDLGWGPRDFARQTQTFAERYDLPRVLVRLDKDGAVIVTRNEAWQASYRKPIVTFSTTASGDSALA